MQKEVMGMKVSGNIISELADRIPSNFMALNELIKNAYDADATSVSIYISTSEKKIVFQDDGCGMDRPGMENLLHIARSNKNYAVQRPNGRITQGEKGLGALATFHFGNSVTWDTSLNNVTAYKFTVLKNKILEKDDINQYKTIIEEVDASFKGTRITITDIQRDDFDFFVSTLKNKKTTSKLVRSLFDSTGFVNFVVNLYVDEKLCVDEEDLIINESNNKERIYRVEYDSTNKNNKINFYYNDTLVFQEEFILDNALDNFRIKCKLNIYDLNGKVSSAHFPALYHKEEERPYITPLVYINQGFFKNYTLFDVDVVRKIRSADSLAQMTGEIEIFTQSNKLMFNADRTEINENIVTAKLKTEIERLNKAIQKRGSFYKKPFRDMNRGRLPIGIIESNELDISGKDSKQLEELVTKNIVNSVYSKLISYQIYEDKAIYTFLGQNIEVKFLQENTHEEKIKNTPKTKNVKNEKKSSKTSQTNNENPQKAAVITLTRYKEQKTIGITGQINLYNFIVQKNTKDSSGKEIPLNEITISDDKGLMKSSNILPAIQSPQEIKITYTYNDTITGIETKILRIVFIEPPKSPIRSNIKDNTLIHNHGIGGFKVSFDNVVCKLVDQINSLKDEDYSEMIACSLRTLFELSVDAIKTKGSSSANFRNLQLSISPNISLEDRVKKIVEFVGDKKRRQIITDYLTKNRFFTNVGNDF